MKKIAIFTLFLSLVLFGCAEKSEPEFTYVKNYSDYPVEISYGDETKTVAKFESSNPEDSTLIINATSNLTYSLNQKDVKTIIIEDSNSTPSEIKEEIQVLESESYGGFYDGNFCNILKFTNNSEIKQYEKYIYSITNNSSENKEIYAESFSAKNFLIESEKSCKITFYYKNPEIYVFNESDFTSYESETDKSKKETLLSELKEKSIQFTKTPETQTENGYTIYLYSIVIED